MSQQNNSSIQINLGLCWTCDEKVGTHKEFRDALGENEITCDACHREEYPEKYDEEELCPCCGTDCYECHMEKECSCPDKEQIESNLWEDKNRLTSKREYSVNPLCSNCWGDGGGGCDCAYKMAEPMLDIHKINCWGNVVRKD